MTAAGHPHDRLRCQPPRDDHSAQQPRHPARRLRRSDRRPHPRRAHPSDRPSHPPPQSPTMAIFRDNLDHALQQLGG